jgi:hypothetical protein
MSEDYESLTGHLFPKDWLQKIVERHPFAMAQQNHKLLLRIAEKHGEPYEDQLVLVILLPCVIVLGSPNGEYTQGLMTYPGVGWIKPPRHVRIVRLDPPYE